MPSWILGGVVVEVLHFLTVPTSPALPQGLGGLAFSLPSSGRGKGVPCVSSQAPMAPSSSSVARASRVGQIHAIRLFSTPTI